MREMNYADIIARLLDEIDQLRKALAEAQAELDALKKA